MKFGELRSIAHNIADSMAEGNGFLVGLYYMDVFAEAEHSADGYIEVDFLTGKSAGGDPSRSLALAFVLYSEALPPFCEKHGTPSAAFRKLNIRFFTDLNGLRRFNVTVEAQDGRQATDEYAGIPGRRIKVLDPLGRARKKPSMVTWMSIG